MPHSALPSTWRQNRLTAEIFSRARDPWCRLRRRLFLFPLGKHLAARRARLTAAAFAVPDPSLPGREPHPRPPRKAAAFPVI